MFFQKGHLGQIFERVACAIKSELRQLERASKSILVILCLPGYLQDEITMWLALTMPCDQHPVTSYPAHPPQ